MYYIKRTNHYYGRPDKPFTVEIPYPTREDAQAEIDAFNARAYTLDSGECSRPDFEIVEIADD
ncbi:hypothetical protein [Desulfovibrio porci]|uniref:hypothetical protein n=1 Tax=Desulfovibrio porci TaxID=2605782 RepID=UPI003A95CE20